MANVFDVANYILLQQDEDAGDTISNLKLQKLVYYCQGFTLAITGTPLFPESIQAWEHGPVVEPLYHQYKEFKSSAIPMPDIDEDEVKSKFSDAQIEIINEVCDVYGQYSAWKLRNFTHDEEPWINRYGKNLNTISHDELTVFFKQLLITD